jgi:hypothetical protein
MPPSYNRDSFEDYSSENNLEPYRESSMFSPITGIFSSLGKFFTSFTSDDASRRPSHSKYSDEFYDDDDDYVEERERARTSTTTETIDQNSKRPKREPVLSTKEVTSTTQSSWFSSFWKGETESATTTTTETEMPTTEAPTTKDTGYFDWFFKNWF